MAKATLRKCSDCQTEQMTASKSMTCAACYQRRKVEEKIQQEILHIKSIYMFVDGPHLNDFGKRCYTFIHSDCGTLQTWRYDNLLKQLKANGGKIPCSSCGAKERQQKAMAGYIAKFNLSERARHDLRAYTKKVRTLSEKTYRDNIDTLNPQRLPRKLGNQGWHLDHKVSIVECFKRGWTPEQAAALNNLQLLDAKANMSKGRKC